MPHRLKATSCSSLDDAIAVWGRLHQTDQAKFFAALLGVVMAKPALEAEVRLFVSVVQEWEAKLTAAVVADLERPEVLGQSLG